MAIASVTSSNGKSHSPSEPPISTVPRDLRRIAVVVNGRAKNVTREVISTLDRILKGGDLFVSRSLDDAREIARTLVVGGYGTVLTGGGDGTFTVMVTEVVREARRVGSPLPRFGLLKLGTGNSLAWVVGARGIQGELGADIEKLSLHAGSRSIRLVEVDGIISPFCGLGADARVLGDYGWMKDKLSRTPFKRIAAGPLSYGLAAATRSLPRELLRGATHCRIVNTGEEAFQIGSKGSLVRRPIARGEVLYEGPMRFTAISTIPYYGYGLRMFPYADERPDRMQLRLTTMSPFEFLLHLRDIWKGSYEGSKSVFDFLVDAVTIELTPEVAFQIGGDAQGVRSRVEVRLAPEPIELVDMYAPPSIAP
jgi:diacylglycerol kinase family enzyme